MRRREKKKHIIITFKKCVMKKFICTVCGYVHEGDEAPEICPQCKQPKSKFKELVETESTFQRGMFRSRDVFGYESSG